MGCSSYTSIRGCPPGRTASSRFSQSRTEACCLKRPSAPGTASHQSGFPRAARGSPGARSPFTSTRKNGRRRRRSPPHGTIYVPQPLPDHLQPGYTLQDEDVAELRNLVQRRDTQIQFLYERELKFSETLTKVLGSPVYRLAAAVTWPLRAIKRKLKEMR